MFNLTLFIHVPINWQLSKPGIRWPVPPDCIAGSVFFEVICWQVTSFQMIADSSSVFFKCIGNKFWFQTDLGREISASCYRRRGKGSCFWQFLTMVTRWSRSTSNLTGEIIWKIYAASAKLTRFCVILWWFNCLFLLDVKKELQLLSRFFCYSWLVCLLGFWLRNAPLVKVIGNPFSECSVFKNELTHFTLLDW